MTDLRTAAQQALEALEEYQEKGAPFWACDAAVTALRAALAQQTQTPCDIAEDGVCEVIDCCRNSTQEEQEPTVRFKCTVVDDQHPNGVPFEQWVNAPQQEQEPVAWRHKGAGHFTVTPLVSKFPEWEPLYTTLPRREWRGLTDVEWMNIVNKNHAWFGTRPDEVAHEVCKLTETKLKEKNA
jgi:hypothetical protein